MAAGYRQDQAALQKGFIRQVNMEIRLVKKKIGAQKCIKIIRSVIFS